MRTARVFAVLVAMLTVSCSRGAPSPPGLEAEYDKQTGKLRQILMNKEKDGKPDITSYMDGTRFLRIEIDQNEDGKVDRWEYYAGDQKLEKVGFSRANDGVADAWAFQAPDGSVARIEVSTRRDGEANRVEFYEGGILKRAEEDTNQDGRVDKWETYEKGSLTVVAFDTTGKGTPTHVIDYTKEVKR